MKKHIMQYFSFLSSVQPKTSCCFIKICDERYQKLNIFLFKSKDSQIRSTVCWLMIFDSLSVVAAEVAVSSCFPHPTPAQHAWIMQQSLQRSHCCANTFHSWVLLASNTIYFNQDVNSTDEGTLTICSATRQQNSTNDGQMALTRASAPPWDHITHQIHFRSQ